VNEFRLGIKELSLGAGERVQRPSSGRGAFRGKIVSEKRGGQGGSAAMVGAAAHRR
jgi:hypothetical protein